MNEITSTSATSSSAYIQQSCYTGTTSCGGDYLPLRKNNMSEIAKHELCVQMANDLYPTDAKKRKKYIENCMRDDRAKIWKMFFPDKPMPDIEENAVEKYAGFLDKYLPFHEEK